MPSAVKSETHGGHQDLTLLLPFTRNGRRRLPTLSLCPLILSSSALYADSLIVIINIQFIKCILTLLRIMLLAFKNKNETRTEYKGQKKIIYEL